MDEQKKETIRQEVREDFRLGRVRMFRVEGEQKLRAEIAEDRSRLFAAFKQLGPDKELELTRCLGRLLMNFSKMASYRGVPGGLQRVSNWVGAWRGPGTLLPDGTPPDPSRCGECRASEVPRPQEWAAF